MNSFEQATAKLLYGIEMVLNLDTGIEEVDIPQKSLDALRRVGIVFEV